MGFSLFVTTYGYVLGSLSPQSSSLGILILAPASQIEGFLGNATSMQTRAVFLLQTLQIGSGSQECCQMGKL